LRSKTPETVSAQPIGRADLPLAAHCVSGEYAMIEFAATAGALDREATVLEALTSVRRAGADMILTYHAREAAAWLHAAP
jgi:porphobilinogen synthase